MEAMHKLSDHRVSLESLMKHSISCAPGNRKKTMSWVRLFLGLFTRIPLVSVSCL